MAFITQQEFTRINNALNNATTAKQFIVIATAINSFTSNDNLIKLADYFKETLQEQDQTVQKEFGDLWTHMQILSKITDATNAVDQYIAYKNSAFFERRTFNFDTNYFALATAIEAQKDSNYYDQYRRSFYNSIHSPLVLHHPKLASNVPSCIKDFVPAKAPAYSPAAQSTDTAMDLSA